LLAEGGLDRRAVSPEEIRSIEPALAGSFHGGFFTQSDFTGDIHKYTIGLAKAARRRGVRFVYDAAVERLDHTGAGVDVSFCVGDVEARESFDATVVCAGTQSRRFAAQLGDRVNIYPVKGYSVTVNL
ncbi:FAD-dependent oxidoreductase, partial [Burkholderia cepacia]|uniref:FAD-dependent oxidoreductase n=1 Tax=Burkholderia cepacia TaxID=292 RepID=UPI0013F3D92D